MYLINNASIDLTGPLPNEAKAEIIDIFCDEGLEDMARCGNRPAGNGYILLEDTPGDVRDVLNEIVDILKPYGIKPTLFEYNRYYGGCDGYDVFTGERFESMDAEDFGLRTASDDELVSILESRGYTVTLTKQEVIADG